MKDLINKNCQDCMYRENIEKLVSELQKENKQLSRQLKYLRSGEYLNQIKGERDMLQEIIQEEKLSNEIYSMVKMTNANTQLCENNDQLKQQIEEYKQKHDEVNNYCNFQIEKDKQSIGTSESWKNGRKSAFEEIKQILKGKGEINDK